MADFIFGLFIGGILGMLFGCIIQAREDNNNL